MQPVKESEEHQTLFICMKEFYKSKQWEQKRERILRRDKYFCQLSLRYGKAIEAKHVHHIFPIEYYPEYRLSDWNLISLCNAEHIKLHDRETHKLTRAGIDLLKRTARKQGIEVSRMELAMLSADEAAVMKP